MTNQQKPIVHGRDHAPGGADPIPGWGIATAGPWITVDTFEPPWGAGALAPAYFRDGSGVVHFRGRVADDGSGTPGPIFAVDGADAPAIEQAFLVPASSGIAAVVVDSTGGVTLAALDTFGWNPGSPVDTNALDLSPISYRAEAAVVPPPVGSLAFDVRFDAAYLADLASSQPAEIARFQTAPGTYGPAVYLVRDGAGDSYFAMDSPPTPDPARPPDLVVDLPGGGTFDAFYVTSTPVAVATWHRVTLEALDADGMTVEVDVGGSGGGSGPYANVDNTTLFGFRISSQRYTPSGAGAVLVDNVAFGASDGQTITEDFESGAVPAWDHFGAYWYDVTVPGFVGTDPPGGWIATGAFRLPGDAYFEMVFD